MGFVRTVLGDVDASALGRCQTHEHVIIDPCFLTKEHPECLIDSVEKAVLELKSFHRANGRAMLDAMPRHCGRNVRKLAEVSRQSAVHLIATTGLHLQRIYSPADWNAAATVDAMAKDWIEEITQGIVDPGSPRSTHRAGAVLISTGASSDFENRALQAAALTQRITGVPIIARGEKGQGALEQIDFLISQGINPRRIVISHLDRSPDPEYHRNVLSRGVFVEYDSAHRWQSDEGNWTLDLLIQLLPQYPKQFLLGMNAYNPADWRSYGGQPGLDFVLTQFLPKILSARLDDTLVNAILVQNPAGALALGV